MRVDSAAQGDDAMTFTNGDVTLGFHLSGSGAPVVFVPDGPGFSAGYLGAVVPYLYGVSGILLDPRGTGASQGVTITPQAFSIANLVSDIEGLRTTMGFDTITLFGHAFGGFIAMAYAAAYPERVRGLILVDSAPPDLALEERIDPLRVARLTPSERAALTAAEAQAQIDPAEAMRNRLRALLPARFSDPANAAQFASYLDSPDDYVPAVAAALAPDLAAHGSLSPLRGLHAPVLAIFGADDPGAAIVAAALRAEFTAPQVVVIPSAGSFPWIEQPKPFYDAVRAFLAANGLGGSAPGD
jgi:pimeloyl-ACP methyl ester carboxylesterase